MTTTVTHRIYNIVSQVFGVPIVEITDESSADTIETWDSLNSLNLVLALEAEFGVSLSPDDAVEMLSVGLIRTILADYGIGQDQATK